MENSNSKSSPIDPNQPLSPTQNHKSPSLTLKSKLQNKQIFLTTFPNTYSENHNFPKPSKSLLITNLKLEIRLFAEGDLLRSFPKILKKSHYKFLEYLHIIFNGSGDIPKKLYPAIVSFIKPLESLREISIAFEDDLSFNWIDLELISKTFKKMKRIRKLHISMDCFGLDPDIRFEERTMKKFNSRLQNFLLLKEFSLEFNIHPLSCISIASLFKSLARIKPLKTFRLVLEGINDQTAASLCSGLKKLTSLENVLLTLFSGIIEDDGVTVLVNEELFIDALKAIKCLENFEFNYYFQAVNPSAINQFFKRLGELENLKRLHLYTSAASITDQSVVSLAEGVKNLKRLQKLYIGFDGYVGFGEEKLENLSESLKNLKQLVDLGLEVPGIMDAKTYKLDGVWLNKLLRSLAEHKNLACLNIRVRIPVKLTKNAKEIIVSCLEDLHALEKLRLSFLYTKCSRMMIDELVKEINEKLKHVSSKDLMFEGFFE